jgi:hypothetical protein
MEPTHLDQAAESMVVHQRLKVGMERPSQVEEQIIALEAVRTATSTHNAPVLPRPRARSSSWCNAQNVKLADGAWETG